MTPPQHPIVELSLLQASACHVLYTATYDHRLISETSLAV